MNHATPRHAQIPGAPTLRRRIQTARVGALAALAMAFTAAAPGSLAAQSGKEALQEASRRFASIESICADFRQEMEVTLIRVTRNSRGRVCQRSPNLFSMTFHEPAGDQIVADGRWFWVSLPSESPGQVIRIPMDSQPGGMDFYRELLESPMEKYEVSEAGSVVIDGVTTHAVLLVPRRTADWREATVWIDPATSMIRRVRIIENNETVRTLTLSDVEVNPDLGEAFFLYTVPDGVSVVTMGGAPQP